MKNVLILYDSVFGNTEKVALEMKKALAVHAKAKAVRIGDVMSDDLKDIDVLLVGSPTRKFSPTPAIKKFLKAIPGGGLKDVQVAAFDTRVDLRDVNSRILNFFVGIFGYAAEPMAALLRKKGGKEILAPEGFIVTGTEGPMRDGEFERARQWAGLILTF
ncbi:flavodoxin family protein [candidate division KSB1 bacterium]|nr:flavodoxin family protein [candidate division KSB1 bacterium]